MSHASVMLRAVPRSELAVVLLVLLAAPQMAMAEEDPYDRPGFYIGASAVRSFNVFEDEIEDVLDVSVDVDDSFGASGRVGYRAASWFAMEVHYEWVDEFDVSVEDLGLPNLDSLDLGSLEVHALTANTRFIIPTWRIQPYLLLGGGGVRFDFDDETGLLGGDDEISWAARLGGGLDLYLTKNLVVTAEGTALLSGVEFSTPFGDIDKLFYVSASAGLQWRF